jgi:hypothetical protein
MNFLCAFEHINMFFISFLSKKRKKERKKEKGGERRSEGEESI